MSALFVKSSTKMSLNERFTHLRTAAPERDTVLDIRQAHYAEQQASARSRRVQMQMEQRPGVRAALARARSRSRSRSRSRLVSDAYVRPGDIRERLSLRRGRGARGFRTSRRDSIGNGAGVPAMRRRSRSRSRSRSRLHREPIMRSRSRSRSRGRFVTNGRGGYRGGRGRRPRSLSRSRGRPELMRMGSMTSLNNIKPRGGGRGRGAPRGRGGVPVRVRRDSITNGITTYRNAPRGGPRGGFVRGGLASRFRDTGRGRGRGGSIRGLRNTSRSIRDVGVGKFNAGMRSPARLRGGRHGSRGGPRGRGSRGRGGAKPVSKDELDLQLDQYMATDPLNLDKDLEAYKQDL